MTNSLNLMTESHVISLVLIEAAPSLYSASQCFNFNRLAQVFQLLASNISSFSKKPSLYVLYFSYSIDYLSTSNQLYACADAVIILNARTLALVRVLAFWEAFPGTMHTKDPITCISIDSGMKLVRQSHLISLSNIFIYHIARSLPQ